MTSTHVALVLVVAILIMCGALLISCQVPLR